MPKTTTLSHSKTLTISNDGDIKTFKRHTETTTFRDKTGRQKTDTLLDWSNRITMIGISIFSVSVGSVIYQYTPEQLQTFMPNYGQTNSYTAINDPLEHYDFKPFGEEVVGTIVAYVQTLSGWGNWTKNLFLNFNNFLAFATGNYDPGESTFIDAFSGERWAEVFLYSTLGQNSNYDVYLYLTTEEKEYIVEMYNDETLSDVEIRIFYSKRFEFLFIDPITDEWFWFYESPSVYDWIVELD